MSEWNLEEYLSHGVDRIIKGILKASLQNPKESIFMMQYAKDSRQAGEGDSKDTGRGRNIHSAVSDRKYYESV